MKRLILALIAALISWFSAQSQAPAPPFGAETLGIPQAVYDEANNSFFTQRVQRAFKIEPITTRRRVNGQMVTVATGHVIQWNTRIRTTQTCEVMGLNLIHDYYHGGANEISYNDTALVMKSAEQEVYIVHKGNDLFLHLISHPKEYQDLEGQKVFQRSRAFVDSLSRKYFKFDLLELESRTRLTFRGTYRDPNTFINSLFSYAVVEGNRVYNRSYVNGRQWNEINLQQMRWLPNLQGFAIGFEWRFLNECVPLNTVESNTQAQGNFGQCGKSLLLDRFNPYAASHTFELGSAYKYALNNVTFDASKSAYIILYLARLPVNGKEASSQCYLNVKTGVCTTFPPKG
jgi:hypothetical protein